MLDWYTGKFDEAIEHLTKAVMLNPTSAILYATRGNCLLLGSLSLFGWMWVIILNICDCYPTATVFLKVKKPNAAIRDANVALQVIVSLESHKLVLFVQKMDW